MMTDETRLIYPVSRSQGITGEISYKPSVYTFVLMMPPIEQKRSGRYWTPMVVLAFALCTLTVCAQLTLTYITGSDILKTEKLAFDTLITYTDPPVDMADQAGLKRLRGHFLEDEELGCCVGPVCQAVHQRCCNAQEKAERIADGLSLGEHVLLQSRKPGGSGAKGKPSEEAHIPGKKGSEGEAIAVQKSVCSVTNTSYDCLPVGVELVDSWQDLDTNGDGIWTIEEARADVKNIACEKKISMTDIFRSICSGILRDAADTTAQGRVPPEIPNEVKERKAISKAYFDWWRGLALICMRTDAGTCSNLITQGVFDGALNRQTQLFHGGVEDLDGVMNYCSRLLSPGGVCDSAMPGGYAVYRARLQEKCGNLVATPSGRYTNPYYDNDAIETMSISYTELVKQVRRDGMQFRFFMIIVLILWYINLIDEFQDVVRLLDFIANVEVTFLVTPEASEMLAQFRRRISRQWTKRMHFGRIFRREPIEPDMGPEFDTTPTSAARASGDFGDEQEPHLRSSSEVHIRDDVSEKSAESKLRTDRSEPGLTSIGRLHHTLCIGLACTRISVLCWLAVSGTVFLLSPQDLVDLVLNALAMAFIFELDEFIFMFLVPDYIKSELEDIKPLRFESSFSRPSRKQVLLAKHLLGLIVAPLMALSVVIWYHFYDTKVFVEALECVCLKTGDSCYSPARDREWWNGYWANIAALPRGG